MDDARLRGHLADVEYLVRRAGFDTGQLPDGDNREGFCFMTDDGPVVLVAENWPGAEEDRSHPLWKFEIG